MKMDDKRSPYKKKGQARTIKFPFFTEVKLQQEPIGSIMAKASPDSLNFSGYCFYIFINSFI